MNTTSLSDGQFQLPLEKFSCFRPKCEPRSIIISKLICILFKLLHYGSIISLCLVQNQNLEMNALTDELNTAASRKQRDSSQRVDHRKDNGGNGDKTRRAQWPALTTSSQFERHDFKLTFCIK